METGDIITLKEQEVLNYPPYKPIPSEPIKNTIGLM